jgi:hypothetical protein
VALVLVVAAPPEAGLIRPEDDIALNIRQLTDVLHCKLQHYFQRKGTEHLS